MKRFALLFALLPGCAMFQSITPATQQAHGLEARKAEELKLLAEELAAKITPPESRLIVAVTIRERWSDYVRLHGATAAALDAPPVVTEQQMGSIVDLVKTIMDKK